MKIREMFNRSYPVFSFEFFPPRTDEGLPTVKQTIKDLAALRPSFCSVTYGAGGGTRERTVDLVSYLKDQLGVEAMMHLACVGHSRDELRTILENLRDRKIQNIIALRGDPPKGQAEFTPHPDGFRFASELTELARSFNYFGICVAGYPEGHIECPDKDLDLLNLKKKVDAGGEVVITQLFFDNRVYFDFVERARAVGITAPIVPGILPIISVNQIKRFSQLCGAHIPDGLMARLQNAENDDELATQIGIEHATRQCQGLLENDVPGIHFYVLNKTRSVQAIFHNLGLARAVAGRA